jgi:hypothetical protein
MKTNLIRSILKPTWFLLATLAATLLPAHAGQEDTNVTEAIAVLRTAYQADRQAFLEQNLQLTESEGKAFWPLYQQYRAEAARLGDRLLKLVLAYADLYPNVPEDRAREMLKESIDLEQQLVKTRAEYLKKAAKVLPASKVLRWAQLENRLDLGLRLQLADAIPLVPAAQPTGSATP